jgi:hypothetical protein
MKLPKTWKTSDGKRVRIDQMNTYHIRAALQQMIRRSIVKFYDKRQNLGYKRGISAGTALRQLPLRWCHQPNYQALMLELDRRCDRFDTDLPIIYYNSLCRLEWSLEKKLICVSHELRK